MIKIIISATNRGLSKLASDGNSRDDVVTRVLDKRSLFSVDFNRLGRTGYAFQLLPGVGILYQEIILLNEVVGGDNVRNGYVMFSIFVPQHYVIKGADIKKTLDDIIDNYKSQINGNNINLDIDLSFVTGKAQELDNNVIKSNWGGSPANVDTLKAALMPVDDNKVADCFRFPTPLHDAFSGFGIVFLTERLLNPAMTSQDGENGYKIIYADIDTNDYEYRIVHPDPQEGATLSLTRNTVKESELRNNRDGIKIGTYSKSGYRPKDVVINAETKSSDGYNIDVELPTLEQKKATLTLKVVNENQAILSDVTCKCTDIYGKEISPANGVFNFRGEECDKDWTISVQCDSYKGHECEIKVKDRWNETKTIELTPNDSTGTHIMTVSSTDKNQSIDRSKQSLAEKGSVCCEVKSEGGTHNEYVMGEKQETGVGQTPPLQGNEAPSDNLSESTSGDQERSQLPPQKTYILPLNDPSKKYLIFKKYVCIAQFKKHVKDICKKKCGQDILEALEKNDASAAQEKLDDLLRKNSMSQFFKSPNGDTFIELAKSAIKAVKKAPLPSVKSPTGVKYNSEKHRLECSCTEKVVLNEVVLNKDKYHEYSIPNPQWIEEDSWSQQDCKVKRKLRKKYRVCIGIASALLLCAIVSLGVCLFGNKDKKAVEDLKNNTFNFMLRNKNALYGNQYCGKIVYDSMESFHSQWADLIKKNEDLKNYKTFISLDSRYKLQTQYKEFDSTILKRGVVLSSADIFDSVAWSDLKNDTMYKHLSKKSEDSLQTLHENKLAEIAEKARLYQSCMDSKIIDTCKCNCYLSRYVDRKAYEAHYSEVKTRLNHRQQQAAQTSPKRTEKDAQNGKTKPSSNNSSLSSGEQKTIKSESDLFLALEKWDNVRKGRPNADVLTKYQYDDKSGKLEDQAKSIVDAACNQDFNKEYKKKNKKINDYNEAAMSRYNEAYNAAKEEPPSRQLSTLLKNLTPKQQ